MKKFECFKDFAMAVTNEDSSCVKVSWKLAERNICDSVQNEENAILAEVTYEIRFKKGNGIVAATHWRKPGEEWKIYKSMSCALQDHLMLPNNSPIIREGAFSWEDLLGAENLLTLTDVSENGAEALVVIMEETGEKRPYLEISVSHLRLSVPHFKSLNFPFTWEEFIQACDNAKIETKNVDTA